MFPINTPRETNQGNPQVKAYFYPAMSNIYVEPTPSLASMPEIAHVATPISPSNSFSDASANSESITGTLNNIRDKYIILPRILGSGYVGSVRECADRATGERFAVKTISKSNPRVRHECVVREAVDATTSAASLHGMRRSIVPEYNLVIGDYI